MLLIVHAPPLWSVLPSADDFELWHIAESLDPRIVCVQRDPHKSEGLLVPPETFAICIELEKHSQDPTVGDFERLDALPGEMWIGAGLAADKCGLRQTA